MLRAFLAFVMIVSIVLFILPNMHDAQVPPIRVAAALIGLVGLYALSTWTGWGYLETFIKVGLTVGALLLVVLRYAGTNPVRMWQVAGSILTLAIVLFGLYVIISGGRFKTRKRGYRVFLGKRRD